MRTQVRTALRTTLPTTLRAAVATTLFALAFTAGTVQAQVGYAEWSANGLPVTLVYPTDTAAQAHAIGPFPIEVALNAAPRAQRHPLVLMSHGTGGSPVADHALAAALARGGFVVAQLLHTGDNHRDTSLAGPESMRRRPLEIIQVIDALARDPQWSARLRLDRVGVHGMSAGGVTGTALAGGQWRLLNLVQHCNAHGAADEGFCFQGAAKPEQRAERQARNLRAQGVPEAYLPPELTRLHGGRSPAASPPDSAPDPLHDPRPDPRIAAVTLAVPALAHFSAESLARIRIPVGVVAAQQDSVLLPRFHSAYLLQHCRTCTLLADLPGAGHFDLLWPWPETVAREVAAGQVRGGLPVPGFDGRLREQAHAKIVAFHRQHLLP